MSEQTQEEYLQGHHRRKKRGKESEGDRVIERQKREMLNRQVK